ncbi:hypothetical protein F4810DRAFT_663785 [Camillea tinctor]|nr:hypothetical protein F4810DRAFT_663785 [Camillea tinctor]
MDRSYIPPWRRQSQSTGSSADTSSSVAEHSTPSTTPSDGPPQTLSDNTERGGRQSVPGRENRGDARGHENNLGQIRNQHDPHRGPDPNQSPPVDNADTYSIYDIYHHFYEGKDSDSFSTRMGFSALNGSRARPLELSYMLLFFDENPAWARYRFVFTRAKKHLLPQYTEKKKAQRGRWESPVAQAPTISLEKRQRDGMEDAETSQEASGSNVTDGHAGVPHKIGGEKGKANRDIPTILDKEYYSINEPPSCPMIPIIDYDVSPGDTHPVAVFEEESPHNGKSRMHSLRFRFVGWFRVARVNVLAP